MGRRNRRVKRQRRMAFINFALVVAAIAIIGFTVYSLQPKPYDPRTLCAISDALPPHTAIIIDKTDEYTPRQAELIADVIRAAGRDLAVGERLTLFELDANGVFDPRGEFSLCNPGRGSQVNPLFRNPKLIEERYAALFERPLEQELSDLVTPKEAPASPILEAIARLGQTEAFSTGVPERRLILISDMLQNSREFSAYGGAGEMPTSMPLANEVSERVRARYGSALGGVNLEVRLIPRDRYVDIQRGGLKAYWEDIFADLGVADTWRDL
ncbi:MAG: hypothetical protein AAF253_02070 [Pseudomonadota bacterium]